VGLYFDKDEDERPFFDEIRGSMDNIGNHADYPIELIDRRKRCGLRFQVRTSDGDDEGKAAVLAADLMHKLIEYTWDIIKPYFDEEDTEE